MMSEQNTHMRFIYRIFYSLIAVMMASQVYAQEDATPVIVSRAMLSEVIEEVPLTGTVVSLRIARLSTEIPGLIEHFYADIGDEVKKDDEILHLKSGIEEYSLSAFRAATEQARQELSDARRRLRDAEALGKNLSVSVNEIQSLTAEVGIDAISVKRLEAEQRQQELRVQKHGLFAPFSGVLSKKLVEVGEWVIPGQAVAELVDNTNLMIEFQVPQNLYTRLDRIDRFSIRFEAFAKEIFEATIVSVVPVTDRSSRTFLIRTRLKDPAVPLIPGISASAVLYMKTARSSIVIDRNAILRYPDGRIVVWTVVDNEGRLTVSERQVSIGLSFDGKVSITEGLDENSVVVIEGNEGLTEGQQIATRNTLKE
jgi:RND family efflux transporter MFP subunit